jgi:hypothetical protein
MSPFIIRLLSVQNLIIINNIKYFLLKPVGKSFPGIEICKVLNKSDR